MPIHRRSPSLILPDDPSPEEWLQCWTLSTRDRLEVLRCRGDANRRRYAVQLCALRAYGRFLPEASPAPVVITNHLAQQLGLPLVLLEEVPSRLATETEQLQRHNPPQSTTYILTCTGAGGTVQKSVTVTVGSGTSACTRYQSGSTIPQGFGVPWDPSTPASLLLKADCTPPTIVLKVGDNNNLTHVYKMAHAAAAGATTWTAVNLYGGTLISGNWYVGFAQGVAQIQNLTNPAYYVGYTCTWTGTAWKCGCRDFACTQSYWQIQRLQQ